jgi:hypothetical protein
MRVYASSSAIRSAREITMFAFKAAGVLGLDVGAAARPAGRPTEPIPEPRPRPEPPPPEPEIEAPEEPPLPKPGEPIPGGTGR